MKTITLILFLCIVVTGCNEHVTTVKADSFDSVFNLTKKRLDKTLLESQYTDTALYYLDKQTSALNQYVRWEFGVDGVHKNRKVSNTYADSVRYWGDSAEYYNHYLENHKQ